MKLCSHRMTVEFMILLCMLTLKVVDLNTGCVRMTLGAVKQAGKKALPGEPAYADLWGGLGGFTQIGLRGTARGLPSTVSGNAAVFSNSGRPIQSLNLGTAHYELAQSRLWAWTKSDRYSQ